MTMNRGFGSRFTSLVLPLIMLSAYAPAQSKSNAFACKEANAAQLCNAANTCGSTSTSCGVDIKRTANAASSTPDIPGAKSNALFCVALRRRLPQRGRLSAVRTAQKGLWPRHPGVTGIPRGHAGLELSTGCADRRTPRWLSYPESVCGAKFPDRATQSALGDGDVDRSDHQINN